MALQDQNLDRHGYLFGQKITHSLSPFLHQLIYDHFSLNWRQIRLDSADIAHFLALAHDPSFYGSSPPKHNPADMQAPPSPCPTRSPSCHTSTN